MHRLTVFIIVAALISCFLSGCISAKETDLIPGETLAVSHEQQAQILSDRKIEPLSDPKSTYTIACFDVREDGWFAIGFQTFPRKVCVFDENGAFQYGFSISDFGSFGVTFTDAGVMIHLVRSGLRIEVDPAINVLEMTEAPSSMANNAYWNAVLYPTKKEINGDTYTVKNRRTFMRVDPFDNEEVLFTSERGIDVRIFIPVVILAGGVGVISFLYTLYKERMKKKNE